MCACTNQGCCAACFSSTHNDLIALLLVACDPIHGVLFSTRHLAAACLAVRDGVDPEDLGHELEDGGGVSGEAPRLVCSGGDRLPRPVW